MEYLGKQTDSKDLATVGMGITGARVGDIIKVKSVDADGKPTAWEAHNDNYELIEKIIIGYSITTSEPSDWSTNWTAYYRNTGTIREPVYEALTEASAPTWTEGTYYSYSDEGVWDCVRSTEPDGTPYAFKHMKAALRIVDPGNTKSGSYLGFYFQSFNTCRAIFSTGGNANGAKFVWGIDIDGEICVAYGCKTFYGYGQQAPTVNVYQTGMLANATVIGATAYNTNYPNIPSGSVMTIYAKR